MHLLFFVILWHTIFMTLLDGKKLTGKIFEEIKGEIQKRAEKLRLAIIVVGKNSVGEKFIREKKKKGEDLGIDVRVYPFDESITTNELRKRIAEIVHEKRNTGVIIQLPLPSHMNQQYILNAIPPEKDVDMLSARAVGNFAVGKSRVSPPVAGAIRTFFNEYAIDYRSKHTVILGAGNLVGKPAALWLTNEKATFSMIEKNFDGAKELLARADIIISGIGSPKYVTGDMVKDGVIVIDAGTSESEGKVSGDVDFDSVSQKASYITPVPGGIGPLTVAMIFKNLVTLVERE